MVQLTSVCFVQFNLFPLVRVVLKRFVFLWFSFIDPTGLSSLHVSFGHFSTTGLGRLCQAQRGTGQPSCRALPLARPMLERGRGHRSKGGARVHTPSFPLFSQKLFCGSVEPQKKHLLDTSRSTRTLRTVPSRPLCTFSSDTMDKQHADLVVCPRRNFYNHV